MFLVIVKDPRCREVFLSTLHIAKTEPREYDCVSYNKGAQKQEILRLVDHSYKVTPAPEEADVSTPVVTPPRGESMQNLMDFVQQSMLKLEEKMDRRADLQDQQIRRLMGEQVQGDLQDELLHQGEGEDPDDLMLHNDN